MSAPPGWENPKPAGRYNLVVIGAGTAGLVAAAGDRGRRGPDERVAFLADRASRRDRGTAAISGRPKWESPRRGSFGERSETPAANGRECTCSAVCDSPPAPPRAQQEVNDM